MERETVERAEELRDLRRRLDAMERENNYLRAVQRMEGKAALAFGQFAFLVLMGRGLTLGIRNMVTAWHDTGHIPVVESAEVLAAVVRRAFRIGVIGLGLTLLPTWLLWRQNQLISEQNLYFREQTDKLQEQIATEGLNTRTARRAQLLSTLYDPGPCRGEAGGATCPPLANVRSRAEAAQAFVQLERAAGVRRVDLARVNLEEAPLAETDLEAVRLDHANLRRADLSFARLGTASLSGAELAGAFLAGVDLGGADLSHATLDGARANEAADFSEANLRNASLDGAWLRTARLDRAVMTGATFAGADLFHATLRGADLGGADLSGARHLSAADLAEARWDARTRWPKGFDPATVGARRVD